MVFRVGKMAATHIATALARNVCEGHFAATLYYTYGGSRATTGM